MSTTKTMRHDSTGQQYNPLNSVRISLMLLDATSCAELSYLYHLLAISWQTTVTLYLRRASVSCQLSQVHRLTLCKDIIIELPLNDNDGVWISTKMMMSCEGIRCNRGVGRVTAP